jgi:hypothetical protein
MIDREKIRVCNIQPAPALKDKDPGEEANPFTALVWLSKKNRFIFV